jgi:broad specificity phosphatase PhoE
LVRRTMTARLTLICHASTAAVRKAAFPADEPIDGRDQADAVDLAKRLRVDRCWTSPELRTRQTAELLKLDAISLAELHDCDYGAWKGHTFAEILARDPKGIEAWLRDPASVPHGGESLLSLMQRIGHWLEGESAMDRRSILVTHASIVRAAIVHAIGASPKSFWRIDVAPLSVTRLSGKDGRWNLVSAGCSLSKGPRI